MIKIDYEGAWKEFKERYRKIMIQYEGQELQENINDIYRENMRNLFRDIEQKHTHNTIDIRRRSDKEIADYCLKKHTEVYLELVCLKQKLRKLSKRRR